MMELLSDSSVWVLISFLIFAFVAVKFGKDQFLGMLDSRIDEIKKEIDTAESLRLEAQQLLAQYQRKQKESEKEAEAILANAKTHAKEIKKEADKNLKELVKRKEKQLEERLERIKTNAKQEIQAYAADLTIKATQEIIADKIDKAANKDLVSDALGEVKAIKEAS